MRTRRERRLCRHPFDRISLIHGLQGGHEAGSLEWTDRSEQQTSRRSDRLGEAATQSIHTLSSFSFSKVKKKFAKWWLLLGHHQANQFTGIMLFQRRCFDRGWNVVVVNVCICLMEQKDPPPQNMYLTRLSSKPYNESLDRVPFPSFQENGVGWWAGCTLHWVLADLSHVLKCSPAWRSNLRASIKDWRHLLENECFGV